MDQKFSNKFIATQGGLKVPNFYSISNSQSSELIESSQVRQMRKNSVFASASVGYKSFLYLDVTGRNDWSSTLPEDNNSYFYPSVSGSFVFSELLDMSWLSYGKLRAGWALTAVDPPAYRSTATPALISDNFNGVPTSVLPGTFNNTTLKPEFTSGFETVLKQNSLISEFQWMLLIVQPYQRTLSLMYSSQVPVVSPIKFIMLLKFQIKQWS